MKKRSDEALRTRLKELAAQYPRHAFYHVMLRGNYRQNIFSDDTNKEQSLLL